MIDRNRLKRIARENFRRNRFELPVWDYLVYFFDTAVKTESKVLTEDFLRVFAELRRRSR
ncbi:MAG: ribonuclease P protein component [Deltaproteobacteria bacterium]|nr:ribonuclease P protein component [Deltaproteobacteria bacterium]